MNATSNIQQWRVTEDNPATSDEELDFERCAALHNHIIELGWVGSGQDLETLDRRAEEIQSRLAPSLVNFLKRAFIGPDDDFWSWHYYLSGLMEPEAFFETPNDLDDEYEEDRFIWLYYYGRPLGHTNGLMYLKISEMPAHADNVLVSTKLRWPPLYNLLSRTQMSR